MRPPGKIVRYSVSAKGFSTAWYGSRHHAIERARQLIKAGRAVSVQRHTPKGVVSISVDPVVDDGGAREVDATLSLMNEAAYLTEVRRVLDELGSSNSDADVTGSGDYWKHCRHAGIEAKVCAATIYSGVRHRHEVARTVIKENSERSQADRGVASRRKAEQSTSFSSESPVESWEVVVKRAGVDPDAITSSAGRRPDEVTSGNVVFAGFNDDEKAAAFSKKMTKAGYISSFGPRRDYTLHEAPRAKDIDEHALNELDLYIENTSELYPQKQAIRKNLQAKINRGVYDPDLAVKLWLYWVDAGAKMYAKEFADPGMWKVIYPKPLRVELARQIEKSERATMHATASEDHREWSKVTLNSEADATALWRQLHVKHTVDQMGKNVWTTASYDVVMKALDRAGVKGHIHREAEETPPVAEQSSAVSSDAAECASCVPWQKVSRDANVAASNAELAAKYGAIKNAKDVYRVVGDAMNKETNEVFLVIPLDLRGELKAPPYEVARGQLSRVTVDPGDVLRAALHAGAEAFLCVHNHPTGKATPSKADRDLTKSIKDATAVYGKSLTYVDHVVIGQKRAYSIGENKMYKIS